MGKPFLTSTELKPDMTLKDESTSIVIWLKTVEILLTVFLI